MTEVLLIEDDVIVQHAHKLIFNKIGLTVDVADSGASALNILKQKSSYEAIFVDIGLPDMSGFDLIQAIREQEKKFLIIALTGYIGETEKQACFNAGATEVIHKPILMNKMVEILKPYLNLSMTTNHNSTKM